MENGGSIPVWFKEADRCRVEEAAALAGYRHLSRYVRDRTTGRCHGQERAPDDVERWAENQAVAGRLDALEQEQRAAQVLLAMLLFLTRRRVTTGEITALSQACAHAGSPVQILTESFPGLDALLSRFLEEP